MHNFPLFEPPNTWAQRWNKPWPLDLETCATTQLLSYESNKYIEQWSTTTRNSLNTNGIFDGIIPSTIWGRHYRQKLIRRYGHRHIPTECWELKKRGQFADAEVIAGIFYRRNHRGIQKRQLRTVTRPVHRWTCRRNHRGIQNVSSVWWQDRFTDEKYWRNHRGIQNVSSVWWQDRFTDEKYWRNHWGIQNGSSVRWHVLFTVRIADIIVRRWIRRQKLIYPLFLLLLLLLFLPHLNSPQLQTTSPPPKKNFPLLSATSHISWSLLVTASVFWFTYEFLSVFVSNSIFLNFNI